MALAHLKNYSYCLRIALAARCLGPKPFRGPSCFFKTLKVFDITPLALYFEFMYIKYCSKLADVWVISNTDHLTKKVLRVEVGIDTCK